MDGMDGRDIRTPKKLTPELAAEIKAKREKHGADIQKHNEIAALKKQLANMDYMTSKHIDGEYTDGEWAAIASKRKGIRESIRKLEGKKKKSQPGLSG